jgi:hypothetical protein
MAPGLGPPTGDLAVSALTQALEDFRVAARSIRDDDKKKKTPKKKKKRSRSSSSSRSRSSSSSDGSDGIPRWDPWERRGKISSKGLAKLESLRFRKRCDLVNFAGRRPGALTAHLMYQLRTRMMQGAPESMKDLYAVDAGLWSATATGLKEVRDQREVAVLARILTLVNQKKVIEAADVAVQRVREVLSAKRAGGSWEKAELLSLLPTGQSSGTALPDGALAL